MDSVFYRKGLSNDSNPIVAFSFLLWRYGPYIYTCFCLFLCRKQAHPLCCMSKMQTTLLSRLWHLHSRELAQLPRLRELQTIEVSKCYVEEWHLQIFWLFSIAQIHDQKFQVHQRIERKTFRMFIKNFTSGEMILVSRRDIWLKPTSPQKPVVDRSLLRTHYYMKRWCRNFLMLYIWFKFWTIVILWVK